MFSRMVLLCCLPKPANVKSLDSIFSSGYPGLVLSAAVRLYAKIAAMERRWEQEGDVRAPSHGEIRLAVWVTILYLRTSRSKG